MLSTIPTNHPALALSAFNISTESSFPYPDSNPPATITKLVPLVGCLNWLQPWSLDCVLNPGNLTKDAT